MLFFILQSLNFCSHAQNQTILKYYSVLLAAGCINSKVSELMEPSCFLTSNCLNNVKLIPTQEPELKLCCDLFQNVLSQHKYLLLKTRP